MTMKESQQKKLRTDKLAFMDFHGLTRLSDIDYITKISDIVIKSMELKRMANNEYSEK